MHFGIMLPLRNQDELTSFLGRLYDLASPDYRHFLTVQQFTDQFGPTAEDYQAVINFAQANGLTVTNTFKNRLLMDVTGTVGQIEAAFNLKINLYQHPTENRTFFAPDREPTVNLNVPLWAIAGLDNYSIPRPASMHAPNGPSPANSTNGSGPGGYYLPSDMRAAYYGGTALTGSGQTVGLIEFGGYDIGDVASSFNGAATYTNNGSNYILNYSTSAGNFNIPINNVLKDGATGAPEAYPGYSVDDGEQVLDIAQAIGMAPGLDQVLVYIAPISTLPIYGGTGDYDIFEQMAVDDTAQVISCSFNWSPADPQTLDTVFQHFKADGQTLFVASGDYGGWPNGAYYYPEEDAYVTAVGGTDLTTSGPGGSWQGETAWFRSGGGISPDGIPIPPWQSGVANSSNEGSPTLRNVPDVAMEANSDNYFCDMGTCSYDGGTSFAAPRWAGFMALVNQQAVAAGAIQPGQGLGFINQLIYPLGESSNYGNYFHVINIGNNDCYGSVYYCGTTWYNAVSGYNLVTGWGSPNAPSLIQALAPMPIVGALTGTTTTQTEGSLPLCLIHITYYSWTFTDGQGNPHTFPGTSSFIGKTGTGTCKGVSETPLDEWSADGLYYLEAMGGVGSITAHE
jgi:subtilase family serine protease